MAQSIFDQIRQNVGRGFETFGTSVGLPEFGISERVAGGNTPWTGLAPTSQNVFQPTNYLTPQGTGQILPSSTGPRFSTGGGGGQPSFNNPQPSGPYIPSGFDPQFVPGTPQYNEKQARDQQGGSGSGTYNQFAELDNAYQPALTAYNQYAQTLQSALPSTLQGIESEGAKQTGLVEAERASQAAQAGSQRSLAQSTTAEGVSQQRRGFNELQRGLQAAYGSTTGTGAFTTELAYRDYAQRVGGLQKGLEQTLSQIGQTESDFKLRSSLMLSNIAEQTSQAKVQARQKLDEDMAKINMAVGELSSQKAAKKMDMLQNYQNNIITLEKQSKEFQQQLLLKILEGSQAMDQIKAKAQADFQKATTTLGNYVNQFKGLGYAGYTVSPEYAGEVTKIPAAAIRVATQKPKPADEPVDWNQ